MKTAQSAPDQHAIVREYERYLLSTCGVTSGTAELFTWHVSRFLKDIYGNRNPDLGTLVPRDISRYILSLSSCWKLNTRKGAVTSIRSFLRWLRVKGLCSSSLVCSVPSVSASKNSTLPAHISSDQVEKLLDSFDLKHRRGLRAYAAVICMVKLGLRVSEVARLTLDDIDWIEGTVSLSKPKGRKGRVLPLPHEVGEAIIGYLRNGRPPTEDRHIFISHRPGEGTALVKGALRHIVSKAVKDAGIDAPTGHTRILRHTAATQLIRSGATIKEISDILGHRSIDTTCIYAKLDTASLEEAAMPWPVEVYQ
jgi:site-specific recombinase XerD